MLVVPEIDEPNTQLFTRIAATGPKSIKFVCLVAAPEGVKRFHDSHPTVPIFTAALDERLNEGSGSRKRYRFAKEFHVSPFLDMDVRYDWRFGPPGEKLAAHMQCFRDGALELDATTALTRRAIDGRALASVLTRYPFITAKVIAGIYLEAARLKLKGHRVYPHPKDRPRTTERVA